MKELEEFEYVNSLYNVYGELLTDSQKYIVEQYYVYNLSLTEISEGENITRTAVSDCLKKSINKLKKYEEALCILEKTKQIDELLDKVDCSEDIKKRIREIL